MQCPDCGTNIIHRTSINGIYRCENGHTFSSISLTTGRSTTTGCSRKRFLSHGGCGLGVNLRRSKKGLKKSRSIFKQRRKYK